MSNRNLIPIKTSIFRNKLAKILEQLQKTKDKIPQQTKEAIVAEAVRLLSIFYKTIDGAQFNPAIAVPGSKPELEDYNEAFETIKDDIDILFTELENFESVVVEQFNLITAQTNRINSRIKRLSSRITDFTLYSKLPIKNALFFTDSFADASKIESASPLLNASECNINQAEGIITLPVDQANTTTINVTLAPVINSNSNGRPGNNEEVGAFQINNTISTVLDNNPDTWFEYERVVREDDGIALVLDFTINMNEEQIINFIRINPNNFGTKTEVEISDIATSVDGQVYTSIKDEIPIAGFLVEDEANVFNLAPSTSKFAGQGLFTFTPRFAKYVKIILRQISPYLITTVQGQQFRYAIGIRDVEIKRLAFENIGELVSSTYEVGSEIKKIALRANQIPLDGSELADIVHQVSLDNGNSWIEIQPLEDDGVLNIPTTADEIININTEDESAIKTATPITSLRYKAILSRKDDNFNESSVTFAEEVIDTTELKSIPLVEPWALTLNNRPVVDSVALLDINFGSRGNPNVKYIIGYGIGSAIHFRLPWDNLQLDLSKDNNNQIQFDNILRIFVGGEEWTRIDDLANAGANDKTYALQPINTFLPDFEGLPDFSKYEKRRPLQPNVFAVRGPPGSVNIFFGDNTNGKSPPNGALIEVFFTDERLFPIGKSSHTSSIKFPTSIDKSTINIYRKGLILQHTIELSKEANIHHLAHRNIIIDASHPIKFTNPDGVFMPLQQKNFKNGLATPDGELMIAGDWSIDKDRGIVYSFSRTDDTPGTVTYFYQEQSFLSSSDWDWGDEEAIHRAITIKNSAWIPNKVIGQVVPSGVKKINLPHLSIIEGSIQFNGTNAFTESNNPFIEEVPFLNGVHELTTTIKTEEQLPTLSAPTVATFVSSVKMHPNTLLDVSFSNTTIFATSVNSIIDVDATGKYFVDRSTSTVYVWTGGDSFTDSGKIIYYTEDPSKIETGSYSIDYERGEIHLQRPVPAGGVTVNYEYADYYIRYNVARIVPNTDWILDPSTKTITISATETSNRARISNISGNNNVRPVTYQVNYKYINRSRRNVADLQTFFTPVLKDYVLQVVTSDLL
jgi:hypothetical protein